jgi:protein tyrosine phosphatase (PTP) superfamily phosphohydrolase (DUF442 family)
METIETNHVDTPPQNLNYNKYARFLKVTLKMFGLAFRKYIPVMSGKSSIEDIFNYINYKENLSSSGQPSESQLCSIRKEEYDLIINLAPYGFVEGYLNNEESIVKRLGMDYVHIPVEFFAPKQEDFKLFVDTMKKSIGKKIWVHCAANARASSFVFRYRWSILGESKEDAIWDLREIWEPVGPWEKFIYREN